jgi:hypothetical protein
VVVSASRQLVAARWLGALRLLLALAALAAGLALLSRPSSAQAAEPLCTDTWTGPAEGNWQTPADWSSGQVPTAADVACVAVGDTVVVTSTSQAGLLEGEGALVISGAALELTDALESSGIASLTLNSATLVDAETLDVSGSFVSNRAAIVQGAGSLVVGPKAQATIDGEDARGWCSTASP